MKVNNKKEFLENILKFFVGIILFIVGIIMIVGGLICWESFILNFRAGSSSAFEHIIFNVGGYIILFGIVLCLSSSPLLLVKKSDDLTTFVITSKKSRKLRNVNKFLAVGIFLLIVGIILIIIGWMAVSPYINYNDTHAGGLLAGYNVGSTLISISFIIIICSIIFIIIGLTIYVMTLSAKYNENDCS